MPYFALIIMYYHVKIACYQGDARREEREELGREGGGIFLLPLKRAYARRE